MPKNPAEIAAASSGQSKDIVDFMVRRETKCAECGQELFDGNMDFMGLLLKGNLGRLLAHG